MKLNVRFFDIKRDSLPLVSPAAFEVYALRAHFQRFGRVSFFDMIEDPDSGHLIARVQMEDETQARNALETLDGTYFRGMRLRIDESREMVPVNRNFKR
jgi:RNA recognition motif-containing protein